MIAGTYVLDPAHTTIGFVARHAMVTKTRGKFEDFEGTITVAENIADSKADVTIKSASINTGNDDRDGHVKGDDFFAVEKYPELTFTAISFNVDEAGNGTVTGDLTIKGVTKPVTLDVETEGLAEDPFGNTRFGFEATTKINRLDYGIDFNAPLKTGGVLVSEEIKIELEVSAIKQ
ncbi:MULTISPECIES: YceI family protein [Corynebacterium]|uniref:Polyisoprenoid-binding protein n=1 Tax=Corynebacterium striatum TaxID=43770 RepID=A0ABC8CKE5_CORST|nr:MULTISPECIES: YceI family protein [Corynebacterium]ATZ06625.1 polyisoprenoid-binding protein [Corynebacterium striatum]ATZ08979.1 polyisoprenoid-binding protein [Corynebacterium striatum]EGT5576428.1 polyisoprenoid-binding protein [Corynebacterium striatum]EGT5592671.1 polyisoprenoid-binding protein [Corynebacterium striatum]EGT5595228.1 polyisoprenoid-binding protein [Corynebacterium striatum]